MGSEMCIRDSDYADQLLLGIFVKTVLVRLDFFSPLRSNLIFHFRSEKHFSVGATSMTKYLIGISAP